MSDEPKMSTYSRKKKIEDDSRDLPATTNLMMAKPTKDPLTELKILVKRAPAFNPNATAKEYGEFSATYAEWLSVLKQVVE